MYNWISSFYFFFLFIIFFNLDYEFQYRTYSTTLNCKNLNFNFLYISGATLELIYSCAKKKIENISLYLFEKYCDKSYLFGTTIKNLKYTDLTLLLRAGALSEVMMRFNLFTNANRLVYNLFPINFLQTYGLLARHQAISVR